MIKDTFYCISATSNVEKRQRIINQCNKFNVKYQFVYGVDYKFFDKIVDNELLYAKNPNDYHEYACKHFSCDLAHYTTILAAYHDGLERLIIIEDDAQFCKDFEYLERCIEDVPEDADILKIGFSYSDTHLNHFDDLKGVYIPDIYSISTVGYMINNRETMKSIIDTYAEKIVQADSSDIFDVAKYKIYTLRIPAIISCEVHYIYESYLDIDNYIDFSEYERN